MPDGKCDLPLTHPSLGFSFPVGCLSGHGTIVGFSFAVMSVYILAAFFGYVVKEYTNIVQPFFSLFIYYLLASLIFFFLLVSFPACAHAVMTVRSVVSPI